MLTLIVKIGKVVTVAVCIIGAILVGYKIVSCNQPTHIDGYKAEGK